MNLQDILRLKYPNVDFKIDIILQDDGKGVYIKEWNLPGDIPSKDTINQLEVKYKEIYSNKQKLELFQEANRDILSQLYDIDKKSIRALRENNIQRLEDLDNQANVLRTQLKEVL